MSLIFYLSSQSGQPRYPWLATLGHIFEYTVLTAVYLFALDQNFPFKLKAEVSRLSIKQLAFLAFFLSSFYGFTDELHQYFVPGRFADPLDLLTDALAAAFVAASYWFYQWRSTS
jgi:VanZ family protein